MQFTRIVGEGILAHAQGVPFDSNPYLNANPRTPDKRREWDMGWRCRQLEVEQRAAPTAAAREAGRDE